MLVIALDQIALYFPAVSPDKHSPHLPGYLRRTMHKNLVLGSLNIAMHEINNSESIKYFTQRLDGNFFMFDRSSDVVHVWR